MTVWYPVPMHTSRQIFDPSMKEWREEKYSVEGWERWEKGCKRGKKKQRKREERATKEGKVEEKHQFTVGYDLHNLKNIGEGMNRPSQQGNGA